MMWALLAAWCAHAEGGPRKLLSRRSALSRYPCSVACKPGYTCDGNNKCVPCDRDWYNSMWNSTQCSECGQWVKTKSGKQWKHMYTYVDAAASKGACMDLYLAFEVSAPIAGGVTIGVGLLLTLALSCGVMCLSRAGSDRSVCSKAAAFSITTAWSFAMYIVTGLAMLQQPKSFAFDARARISETSLSCGWGIISIAIVFIVVPLCMLSFVLNSYEKKGPASVLLGIMCACSFAILALCGVFLKDVPDEYIRDSYAAPVDIYPSNTYTAAYYGAATALLWVFGGFCTCCCACFSAVREGVGSVGDRGQPEFDGPLLAQARSVSPTSGAYNASMGSGYSANQGYSQIPVAQVYNPNPDPGSSGSGGDVYARQVLGTGNAGSGYYAGHEQPVYDNGAYYRPSAPPEN